MRHITGGLILLVAWGAGFGCSPSREALLTRLQEDHPRRQAAAIATLATQGDRTAVPYLIDLLEAEDDGVRWCAAAGLQRLTDKDFGFHRATTDQERADVVARWRAWWAEEQPVAEGDATPSPETRGP